MMNSIFRSAGAFALLLVLAGLFTACDEDSEFITPGRPDFIFQALTDGNQLLQLNVNDIGSSPTLVAITGLQSNETILSIDYRPATGQLYGLGSTSRLYIINPASGQARPVGTGAFTPAISGTAATIDFNPAVDRLRLVSNTGQNLRLNPETGTVAVTDGAINGVTNAAIVGTAYSNNVAGAVNTVLYGLDATTDKLYRQEPPNDGTLVEVGNLSVDIAGAAGFDISPDGTRALAALSVSGSRGLYEINLSTGSARRYDNFSSSITIIDLAIPTSPVAYGVDIDNNLVIFAPSTPQTQIVKPITGVESGEQILGIDMRPLNGQLYGLSNTGRLYTFDLATGAATTVGAGTSLPIAGTDFGFDFNPVVDRIRIVSDAGVNLRVDPANGTVTRDAALNPGTPSVTAAAYTNNSVGATTTVLYSIDSATEMLYRQDSPNNGTLVAVGALGVNATGINGFDIGGTSGTATAILTVGTTTSLYTINLTSGAATKGPDLPKQLRGISLGLGF